MVGSVFLNGLFNNSGPGTQQLSPGLRSGFAAAHHLFADAALPDVDVEFEQFAVDAGCTPPGDSPGTSCGSDLSPHAK